MDYVLDKGVYRGEPDLLSRLYTLRAGLSYAAQEKMIADEIIAEGKKKLSAYDARIKEHLSKVEADMQPEEARCAQLKKWAREAEWVKRAKAKIKSSAVFLVFTLLSLIFFGFYFVYVYAILPKNSIDFFNYVYGWAVAPVGGGRANWGFFALLGCAVLSLGLAATAVQSFCKACGKIDGLRDNKKYNAALKALNKKIAVYNDLVEKYEKSFGDYKKAVVAEVVRVAAPHMNKANAVVQALNNTYRDIIDYRDWRNVDLIIFYFETRRVRDMETALDRVDRERQTRAIVSAMNNASAGIERAISSEFSRLAQSLHKGFGQLSTQIGRGMQYINESIRAQTSRLEYDIKANTAASFLVTEAQLQTALYKSGKISSENLVSGLKNVASGIGDIEKSFHSDSFDYSYRCKLFDD